MIKFLLALFGIESKQKCVRCIEQRKYESNPFEWERVNPGRKPPSHSHY